MDKAKQKKGGRIQPMAQVIEVPGLGHQVAPHDKEIEQALLGAMMILPRSVADVVAELPSTDIFYFDAHKSIYNAIKQLYHMGGAIDILTVVERLRSNGELEKVGGAYYVTSCTNHVVNDSHNEYYISILKKYYLQRESYRMGAELFSKAYDGDPIDLLNEYQVKFTELQEGLYTSNEYDMGSTLVKMIQQRQQIEPGKIIGLDCGFYTLNKETSGLCAPDLIIIAARPGQGKTAKVIAQARAMAVEQKIPVGIFSLEMSKEQLIMRLEAADSGLDHNRIRQNLLNDQEKQILFNTWQRLANSPLYIDDTPGISIQQLRTKAQIMKRKYGIKALYVDYLQLMSGDGRASNREAEISSISRGLKLIAKELQIPVIALSQLSRECEKRPDKMPQLSDLRESGAIEQDADVVMFLMRPEYYGFTELIEVGGTEYHPKGLMLVIIAKNRHNQPKNVALRCDLGKMRIEDFVGEGGEVW